MRKEFSNLCKAELINNKSSFVLLGDIGVGSFLDKEGNLIDRVINMGVAEQALIGFGAGLSTYGGNIIVHTIAPFLVERCLEQIKICCGYNQLKLILISANGPYDYDKLGPSHHCPADVNLLSNIPGINIRVPSTIDDLKESFQESLSSKETFYIRLTSRYVDIENTIYYKKHWKRIFICDHKVSLEPIPCKKAFVCIGESLAYCIKNLMTMPNSVVYWTSDPFSEIPRELDSFEEVKIYEPYYQSLLSTKNLSQVSNIKKYSFKKEFKKDIRVDLGWEDFYD